MGGVGDTLQGLRAKVLVFESSTGKASHALANHHAAWLRDALQPGSKVHRLANRALLDGRRDYYPSRDAYANSQASDSREIYLRQRIDNLQSCTDCTLGLAFVVSGVLAFLIHQRSRREWPFV